MKSDNVSVVLDLNFSNEQTVGEFTKIIGLMSA